MRRRLAFYSKELKVVLMCDSVHTHCVHWWKCVSKYAKYLDWCLGFSWYLCCFVDSWNSKKVEKSNKSCHLISYGHEFSIFVPSLFW